MSQTIRMMEVILTLEQGGAQQLLVYKLEYLRNQGYFVCVVTFEDGPVRLKLEQLGIPVEIIPAKRSNILYFPYFLAELNRVQKHLLSLITSYEITVVQTHLLSIYDFIVAYVSRKVPSVKALIWTFHNTKFEIEQYDRLSVKVPVYRLLYRFMVRYCDAVIAVSDDVRDAISQRFKFPDDKLYTIENAIPMGLFQNLTTGYDLVNKLNIADDTTIIMTVGRLTPQKGHQFVLEAVPLILQHYPNIHLCFVGEGEELKSLHAFAVEHHITNYVSFLGNRENIPDLLANASIVVFPSLWEGFSLALLEAMAAHKPIVATAVSGTSQLIVDKVNGRLVETGNSTALAWAIIDLLEQPEDAEHYGEQAFETVRNQFDIARLCNEHIDLYQSLLQLHT